MKTCKICQLVSPTLICGNCWGQMSWLERRNVTNAAEELRVLTQNFHRDFNSKGALPEDLMKLLGLVLAGRERLVAAIAGVIKRMDEDEYYAEHAAEKAAEDAAELFFMRAHGHEC